MKRLAPIALAFALTQLGCAYGRTVLVDASEHGLYRRARASATVEDRLAASQRYLTEYPNGVYTSELKDFFQQTEPLVFAKAKESTAGLEAYLRALPHGPRAAEATLRLRDLRALSKAENADLAGAAEEADAAVLREVNRRIAVRERIQHWIGLFLDPSAWNLPIGAAKADLIIPWSLGLPWPHCERVEDLKTPAKKGVNAARICKKLLQLDYRAIEDGVPQERQALVEVAMWQDEAGKPLSVHIGGPDLFLRIDETVTARSASADDPEAKLRGAENAVDLAQNVFSRRVSKDPACKKTSDSDVLRLACGGVELRVLAGALDGEDDRFVVTPAPAR